MKLDLDLIVNPRVGLINRIIETTLHHDDPTVYSYGTIMSDTSKYSYHQCNIRNGGAGITREQAILATLGESIERYCSNFYYREDLIYGSYEKFDNTAVNPSAWSLFSDTQYKQNSFPYVKFTKDINLMWTKAKNLISEEECLVPASMVYLPYHPIFDEQVTAPSISTGLSCRDTKEGAILYGIYECIERDAFTIFWLNALTMRSIDLEKTASDTIKEIYSERFKRKGIEYYVYDITLDINIPTYFTVAYGSSNIGKLFCVGTATNLNGEKALIKSLIETAQARPYYRYEYVRNPNWTCKKDFSDVNNFDDHARVYTHNPSLVKDLKFCNSIGSILTDVRNTSQDDEFKDLLTTLSLLKSLNLDVLVVDLTTRDIRELGLYVVKVLIPGLQPLHGDHRYPFLGGQRLYNVPVNLGLRDTKINEKNIFKYPHPFP